MGKGTTPLPIFNLYKMYTEDINEYSEDIIDVDNFSDEDFENFDDFAHDSAVINQRLAPQRRAEGVRIMEEKIKPFLAKLDRLAEVTGKPKHQILIDMLRQDPNLVERVNMYLEGEGYEPAMNFDDLAAQAAYARATQVRELQDEYCMDNYDEVDNLFGKKGKAARQQRKKQRSEAKTKRQATRQQKKQVKQENKVKRKARRGELIDAKFNRKIAQEQREQEEAEREPEFELPELNYPDQSATNELYESETMDLADPTPEVAQAELIGEEMEEGFFEGDVDTFLPFLAGALEVGGQLVSGAKQGGADFTNLKTLFGRKQPAKGSKTNLGAKLPEALDAGIKNVMTTIENKKKKDFLRENMIWIILGVVAIFLLGRSFK